MDHGAAVRACLEGSGRARRMGSGLLVALHALAFLQGKEIHVSLEQHYLKLPETPYWSRHSTPKVKLKISLPLRTIFLPCAMQCIRGLRGSAAPQVGRGAADRASPAHVRPEIRATVHRLDWGCGMREKGRTPGAVRCVPSSFSGVGKLPKEQGIQKLNRNHTEKRTPPSDREVQLSCVRVVLQRHIMTV